jgi:hypothetical protein
LYKILDYTALTNEETKTDENLGSFFKTLKFVGCHVALPLTIALGDVVEFEILPPGTAVRLCTKDKYNLPMFSDVCQAETKAQ